MRSGPALPPRMSGRGPYSTYIPDIVGLGGIVGLGDIVGLGRGVPTYWAI